MVESEIDKCDQRRIENKRVVLQMEPYDQKGYCLKDLQPGVRHQATLTKGKNLKMSHKEIKNLTDRYP